MNKNRNGFLNPALCDPEYYITKLRRDDLRNLIENYLTAKEKGIVLDFGSEKAPYESLFQGKIESFLKADLGKGYDVLITSDGFLKQPSSSVDVVLSLQVLEHVEDVDRYLQEAHRVLRPGGLLWLTTHGTWPYHPFPDDYWRWTLPGLKRIVSKHFEIKDMDAMLGAPGYAIMVYMHLWWAATRKINAWQAVLLNRLTGTQRWGKGGDRKKRIRNPYLYLGTLLFVLFAVPLNILIVIIDLMTPESSRKKQSAVFRIAGKKESVP